jgi:tripartite-type tricarboxylate transporter receptor subunit TctC
MQWCAEKASRMKSGIGVGFRILCAAFALAAASYAQAQAYPSKPVRLIVPYPAGGVVDLVARAVADKISQNWGQVIVVEPRPGGSANIGADAVANAVPDGYTLLVVSPFIAVNPHLYTNLKWSPKSFIAVGLLASPPNLWVVPPSLPVKTLDEFVAYAKARPGKLNVVNPGSGTSNHLGQELFWDATGIDIVNVSYKGQPPAIPDLLSGAVHIALMTNALAAPQVKAGKLRALAISSPKRSRELPEVPTVAEAGYGDTVVLPWYGIVAPAGTPKEIVARLNTEINKALKSPDVVERLEKIGAQIFGGSAEEMETLIKVEYERWGKLVKARGIKAD